MTERQILKKIETALRKLKTGDIKGVVNILLELKHRLGEEMEKKERRKEHGDKLRHLMGWYLQLWDNRPPEALRFMQPNQIIGKHLKELIVIYEQNGEDIEILKRDYEEFKETWRTGDKGILHFRSVLPKLKQNAKTKEWGETRGDSYYKQVFGKEDELPW